MWESHIAYYHGFHFVLLSFPVERVTLIVTVVQHSAVYSLHWIFPSKHTVPHSRSSCSGTVASH